MDTITDAAGRVLGPDPIGVHRYRVIHHGRYWTQWVTDDPTRGYAEDRRGAHIAVDLARVVSPPLAPDGTRPVNSYALAGPAKHSPYSSPDDVAVKSGRLTPVHGREFVAVALEAVGWIVAVAAVVAGIALFADARPSFSGPDDGQRITAVAVGFAGLAQGLLLVGFGRIISYLAASTALQRESRDLLRAAVDRS